MTSFKNRPKKSPTDWALLAWKKEPRALKKRPNGAKSPHLVTLTLCKLRAFEKVPTSRLGIECLRKKIFLNVIYQFH